MNDETLAQVQRLQEAARTLVLTLRHQVGVSMRAPLDEDVRNLESAAEEIDLFVLEQAETRTCFNCKQFTLCVIRRQVSDGLAETRYINIDGEGAPGRWAGVFEAVARACMAFEEPADPLLAASEKDVERQREAFPFGSDTSMG